MFQVKTLILWGFFFTCSRWSAGGANGKQRNKTTTSGKGVIPLCCLKIWHEFYFRDWQSCWNNIFQFTHTHLIYLWMERSTAQRPVQVLDPNLSNWWSPCQPLVYWISHEKRGWELDSLWSKTQLRVIIYHSYLFLLLPASIGREWIIRSTKWRNKHGQVRLLY